MLSDHAAHPLLFQRAETVEEKPAKKERPVKKREPQDSELKRPCAHNQWTKQAKKRGKLVLRCLVCDTMWKTFPEFHEKCPAFHQGHCEKGDLCEHPHVYARRESKKKPTDEDEVVEVTKSTTPAANKPAPSPSSAGLEYPASFYAVYEGASSGYCPPDYVSNTVNSSTATTTAPSTSTSTPTTTSAEPVSYPPSYYAVYEGCHGAYCPPNTDVNDDPTIVANSYTQYPV